MEEFINKYGLRIHNIADQINTFRRRDNRTSNIDVTLTSADIWYRVRNWKVSDEIDSDHRVISYSLHVRKPPPRIPGPARYNTKTADWDLYNSTLLGEVGRIPYDSIDAMAMGINSALKTAADKAIMRKRPTGAPGKNPWWSPA